MTGKAMAEASLRSKGLLYKVNVDEKTYIDGFLDGLKAGRHIWHKVANGDLPEKQKEYCCKVFCYGSMKEMVEGMKADMCGAESKELCDYLERILIKYGKVIK